MKKSAYMGIDIGTSSVKAAVFDTDGFPLSISSEEYPLICKNEGMAELNPDTVFDTLIRTAADCLKKIQGMNFLVEGIGLSTQHFSIMGIAGDGSPLTNVFTWADFRADQSAEQIELDENHVWIYNSTGCRGQHPMYPVGKMLWLKEKYPKTFKNIRYFISIKSYVIYKLFNEIAIDITDASTTGYYNIHKFEWDKRILNEILDIDKSRLPCPVEITHLFKGMKSKYADKLGIHKDTPVAAGSGDGMCANAGCGVFDDTKMSCTVGTSGAIRISVKKPLLDEKQRTWCYCYTKDTWVAGGAVNNGGIVLRWLREMHSKEYEKYAKEEGLKSTYALFDNYAGNVSPGSSGLIFLPFLTGERSPGWNAKASGTFHGLRLMHDKKHFIRASMEGVVYRLFSVFEALTSLNNNVKTIIANGGYAKSDVWMQIQADVFNREIAVAGVTEAASFGAAYIAMAATGAIPSLNTKLKCMEPEKVIKPDNTANSIYKEIYKESILLYKKLYQ